ncbi:MAG: phosphoribosylformylglycinamidine synthase I [Planctomycetes bacterium]|nr:phosphoribosylformylglycinamidine synthase I [Planctomycetota bacterium]
MKVLCLRTAGTNCDRELVDAFERAGAQVELWPARRLFDHPEELRRFRVLGLPGGFTYGDDLGAGRIFALELRAFLGEHLRRFVDDGGYVLGVCNGFQILVQTGLLPGLPAGELENEAQRAVSLVPNDSRRFECRWVHLRAEKSRCRFLRHGSVIPMPVAHAEGKFVVRDSATLEALRRNGQIAFRYCTASGGTPSYPEDPNGSVEQIAGICDLSGRVLGLMPHPERNVTPFQHPWWTRLPEREEGEGLALFRDLVEAARS